MAAQSDRKQQEIDERREHQIKWERSWSAVRESVATHVAPFIKKALARLDEQLPVLRDSRPEAGLDVAIRDAAFQILDVLCEGVPGATIGPPPFRTPSQRHERGKKQVAAYEKGMRELLADDREPLPPAVFQSKDEWCKEMYSMVPAADGRLIRKNAGMLVPGPRIAARELIQEALEEHIIYLLHQERKRVDGRVVTRAASSASVAIADGGSSRGEEVETAGPAVASVRTARESTRPRQYGFKANLDKHRIIAETVERHAGRQGQPAVDWRTDGALKGITEDLDKSEQAEIPQKWRDGETPCLEGVKLKGWFDAFDQGHKKLVVDQIRYSLRMATLRPAAAAETER